MYTTSHFIGIQMAPKYFSDIFTGIRQIIGNNDAILELQNPLSVHITLFYLPKILSIQDTLNIRKYFSTLKPMEDIVIRNMTYFGGSETPRIGYIQIHDPHKTLHHLNTLFHNMFPRYRTLPENTLDFIPHLTLFRIKNTQSFLKHKNEIERYVENEIHRITNTISTEGVRLYAVNSLFYPEIQIAIA